MLGVVSCVIEQAPGWKRKLTLEDAQRGRASSAWATPVFHELRAHLIPAQQIDQCTIQRLTIQHVEIVSYQLDCTIDESLRLEQISLMAASALLPGHHQFNTIVRYRPVNKAIDIRMYADPE